jgi:hypothetical protein
MKAMYSMLQRESWNTAASLPSNEVHLVMSVSKRLRGVCTFPVFTSCTHHWHERVSLYVCSGLMGCGECSQNSQLSRYTKPVLQQERLCASVTAPNLYDRSGLYSSSLAQTFGLYVLSRCTALLAAGEDICVHINVRLSSALRPRFF